MTAIMIDGKEIQQTLLVELKEKVLKLKAEHDLTPGIAFIVIENDEPLTEVNFNLHMNLATGLGYHTFPNILPRDTTESALLEVIETYNKRDDVHGILVLLPLPKHIRIQNVLQAIDPDKEVEGLHPDNASRLFPVSSMPVKYPMCVPAAVNHLIDALEDNFNGANYVIAVDRELEETNPIASMVARVGTVTMTPAGTGSIKIINIEEEQIKEHCKQADVLIISTQNPHLVKKDWVKTGALVIDFNPIPVGFRPHPTIEGKKLPILNGGLDVDSVKEHAALIAPAPGGVGPIMLAVLMNNIYMAALLHQQKHEAILS